MPISNFKLKRVTRSYCQTISADPLSVHQLICPVKEAEWLDGWDYTLIYSESGFAEEGCVFISRSKGEADTIWLITKKDDIKKETEFARVTPGSRLARVHITVQAGKNNTSSVKITYTITALSEEGNRFIDHFTQDNFDKDMQFWEATMNHFIETGKPLPHPNPKEWLRYKEEI